MSEIVEMPDALLAEIDPGVTSRITASNTSKIVASPMGEREERAAAVRAEANRDGRWDTWGGDGVGP